MSSLHLNMQFGAASPAVLRTSLAINIHDGSGWITNTHFIAQTLTFCPLLVFVLIRFVLGILRKQKRRRKKNDDLVKEENGRRFDILHAMGVKLNGLRVEVLEYDSDRNRPSIGVGCVMTLNLALLPMLWCAQRCSLTREYIFLTAS